MAKARSKISRQAVKRSVAGRAGAASAARPARAAKGKWIYAFGGGRAQGRAAMRDLLGGKGAGLAFGVRRRHPGR